MFSIHNTYVRRNIMSRAMSRSGRPPLAGGSAVTEKQYSKLSGRGLAARRAADRAKLLANLAGDRAGGPATRSAGAPSTPSTPTSPQTRSERCEGEGEGVGEGEGEGEGEGKGEGEGEGVDWWRRG